MKSKQSQHAMNLVPGVPGQPFVRPLSREGHLVTVLVDPLGQEEQGGAEVSMTGPSAAWIKRGWRLPGFPPGRNSPGRDGCQCGGQPELPPKFHPGADQGCEW